MHTSEEVVETDGGSFHCPLICTMYGKILEYQIPTHVTYVRKCPKFLISIDSFL